MSDEDAAKKREEQVSLLAEAFAAGMNKFREQEEERLAKEAKDHKPEGAQGDQPSGFSIAGFILGE